MSHGSADIEVEYWGNRLEVGVDLILEQHADGHYMQAWVDGLSPRCRAILVERLGIDPDLGIADTRRAILAHRDRLLPFLLLDAATQNKRISAIVEVVRSKLPAQMLDRARIEGDGPDRDRFDRNALMWLLFEQDPANLERVFLVDRTERRGCARMVLEGQRTRDIDAAGAFFQRENIQRILDDYERERHTLRQSYCIAISREGGTYEVFIKRDHRPSFVSRGARNTFGFEREWIVLDFDSNLQRVWIYSLSPEVPLQLANRIASTYFGQRVRYANECIATDRDTLARFLKSLTKDPAKLPLVEVAIRNSSLSGSPQLRLNSSGNESLAPALWQFSTVFRHPLERLADIESIKVFVFKKRVRLVFEPLQPEGTQYIVRYTDQPLNRRGRREFEQLMAREYGIAVFSTEKKYAR